MRNVIERAFEIASRGQFRRMDHLQKQLAEEGYDPAALIGRHLSKLIHALAREAKVRIADHACEPPNKASRLQKSVAEPSASA